MSITMQRFVERLTDSGLLSAPEIDSFPGFAVGGCGSTSP